ncbi:MAG TPA: nitrogen fixation protein NifQ [Rhodocyclaceae bacterium]|nr:nitrogen fixation protein NifQ [Rhodocyclaceae bacterium]
MNAIELHTRLLASSRQPQLPETLALAGVIAQAPQRRGPWRAPIAGLDAAELDRLLANVFPGAKPMRPLLHAWREAAEAAASEFANAFANEFDDLVALLIAHQSAPRADSRWLACAIATASMADNHLWQDLGLPSRVELNALMQTRFAALKRKNSGDMKWKKFFYRQLCEQAEVLICRSPSCRECEDHAKCFETGISP